MMPTSPGGDAAALMSFDAAPRTQSAPAPAEELHAYWSGVNLIEPPPARPFARSGAEG